MTESGIGGRRVMWSGIGELGHFDVVRNSRRWAPDLEGPKEVGTG